MSQWIEDKVRECEEEIARLDAKVEALLAERTRALYARRALLGKPLTSRRTPTKPKSLRKKAPKKNNTVVPPLSAKDLEEVRLRVGSMAARSEEARKVRDGVTSPVDRVET